MRINFLSSYFSGKPALLCAIALLLSVAALFSTAVVSDVKSPGNLLLVTPSGISSPGISVERIEEFTESYFLVTYEMLSSERVSLAYADFPVTTAAVNSCYARILDLRMTEGSFFSKQAWTGRQRHAVLNETAAFSIFGSKKISGNQIKIQGATWLITGVINDGDDDTSRVYIPSSIAGGQVNSFLVLMSASSGIDETFIKNSMKSLGVHETSFDFINLDTQISYLYERAYVIILFLSGFILIFLLFIFINKFIRAISVFKTELTNHYAAHILKENKNIIAKPALLGVTLLICPSLAVLMFTRAVSIFLPWQDIVSLKGKQDAFYPYIDKLYDYETVSVLLFIFSLIFLCINVIVFIRRNYELLKS